MRCPRKILIPRLRGISEKNDQKNNNFYLAQNDLKWSLDAKNTKNLKNITMWPLGKEGQDL